MCSVEYFLYTKPWNIIENPWHLNGKYRLQPVYPFLPFKILLLVDGFIPMLRISEIRGKQQKVMLLS